MTNPQAALIAAATAFAHPDYDGGPGTLAVAWEWAEALDRMDSERAADRKAAREAADFDVALDMGSTCPSEIGNPDVYMPYRWANELARYECANGHVWGKSWVGLPGKGRCPKARGRTRAALLGGERTPPAGAA